MKFSKKSLFIFQTSILLLYAASLYLPAFNTHYQQLGTFPGYRVLISGWAGLFFLDPRWLANILFAICVIGNFSDSGHRVTPILGILLFAACIVFPIRVGYQDRLVAIDSLDLGFYFWSFSLFCTFMMSLHLKKDAGADIASSTTN